MPACSAGRRRLSCSSLSCALQDDFEWQGQTLPDRIRQMLFTVNNRANYYVFDPLEPKDFKDKYAMKAAAYEKYVDWNAKYLE